MEAFRRTAARDAAMVTLFQSHDQTISNLEGRRRQVRGISARLDLQCPNPA